MPSQPPSDRLPRPGPHTNRQLRPHPPRHRLRRIGPGTAPPSLTESGARPEVVAGNWPTRRKLWIRLGLIFALISTALAVGLWRLATITSPESVASEFVAAIGSGDVTRAAADTQVVGAPTAVPTPASSFGRLAPIGYSAVRIISAHDAADSAAVTVGYTIYGQAHQITLSLTRDPVNNRYLLFPNWKVVLTPVHVAVKAAFDPEGLTVDGTKVGELAGGIGTAALLPGTHTVGTSGSGLYQPAHAVVTIALGQHAAGAISLAPMLNASANNLAKNEIRVAMQACATPSPGSACPQTTSCTCAWSLFGDPATGLKLQPHIGSTSSSNGPEFDAYGVFEMVGTESNAADPAVPTRHWAAGIYDASLAWANSAFVVNGIVATLNGANPAGVGVDPPAHVTDDDVLQAVATGFSACAADTSESPSNCPQQAQCDANPTAPVGWSVQGNPVDPANTQDLFDTTTNSYQVSGTDTIDYSITTSGGCDSSGSPTTGVAAGNWIANVAWDGHQLTVIDIEPISGGTIGKT
jgi:hypothetical protein